MTKEEVYDLACKRYAEPAVAFLNGECILGYWVKKEEAPPLDLIFTCDTKGVVLVVRAASWEEVVRIAKLVPSAPSTKTKSKAKGPKKT